MDKEYDIDMTNEDTLRASLAPGFDSMDNDGNALSTDIGNLQSLADSCLETIKAIDFLVWCKKKEEQGEPLSNGNIHARAEILEDIQIYKVNYPNRSVKEHYQMNCLCLKMAITKMQEQINKKGFTVSELKI